MKTLIYFQNADTFGHSGIGRAMSHQLRANKAAGTETTIDKNDDYDVAHINTYFRKSHKALKIAKKRGVPVIVHGHSTYEDFRRSFKCWRLVEPWFDHHLKWMYSRADMIIAPTPYARDLIKSYGLCQNVIAISNGIPLEEYAEDREAQKEFKERFGIQEGEKFVMGVGFPFERKGIIDFFEVARKFPDIKFIWFGALQRAITNEKVARAVKKRPKNAIMAGYCKGSVIHGAYQLASAMFFPSFEETEGIVVLEALASKCPLLVRDIGVYREWLYKNENCRMGSSNEEFEKELRDLLDNGESKERLEKGYQTAKERDLPLIGEQLKKAYSDLLASK